MHVQELIIRSGRRHLSARKYDTIRAGLNEMRARINATISRDFTVYDPQTDKFRTPGVTIDSDADTYFTICKNGKPMRKFTLVNSRKRSEPIPFGHLLSPQNPEMVRTVVRESP